MKFLIPATCFLVSFLAGLSLRPQHHDIDPVVIAGRVGEEKPRTSLEGNLPAAEAGANGTQATQEPLTALSATPKPFRFATAQEAGSMIKRMRQAGAPEAVIRALLVEGHRGTRFRADPGSFWFADCRSS